MSDPNMSSEQHAYWEGVPSRQDEIDELRKEANKEREQATEYFTDLEFANAKCRELQKRIDDALAFAEDVHSENWQETINTMLYILKGENND